MKSCSYFAALLTLGTPLLLADVTVRYESSLKWGVPLPAGTSLPTNLANFAGPSVIRIKGDRARAEMGKFISIVDLATNQITFIEPEKMTFATGTLEDLAKATAYAMPELPSTPPQAQNLAVLFNTDVSSRKTGRAETIHGIAAEETETVFSIKMNRNSVPNGPALSLTMQAWRARNDDGAALRELSRYYAMQSGHTRDFLSDMTARSQAIGQFMGGMVDALQELTKDGPILRLHVEASSPMLAAVALQLKEQGQTLPLDFDPNTPLFSLNQDLVELSTEPLDELIFQVPSEYRKVELEEIVKDQLAEAGVKAR
jgi:hypothetical protein